MVPGGLSFHGGCEPPYSLRRNNWGLTKKKDYRNGREEGRTMRSLRRMLAFGFGGLFLCLALASAVADCLDLACLDCARVGSFRYCSFFFRKGYCECWAGRTENGGSFCVAGGGTCQLVKW